MEIVNIIQYFEDFSETDLFRKAIVKQAMVIARLETRALGSCTYIP
jgi:hypothetical protein